MSLYFSPQFAIDRWPFIPLRLIVGFGFMEHGFAKLAKGPDAFASILQAIGVPQPHFMAWSTILIEILGGLTVILGAFVTLASLPMAAVLLVAMFTEGWGFLAQAKVPKGPSDRTSPSLAGNVEQN
jgi:putative oxidoreductase